MVGLSVEASAREEQGTIYLHGGGKKNVQSQK